MARTSKVKELTRKHIFEYYDSIEELKHDLKAVQYAKGQEHITVLAKRIVQGGQFAIYFEDVEKFLLSVGIKVKENWFEQYTNLIVTEIATMIKGV